MLKIEVSFRGLIVVGLALLSLWALFELWPVVLLVITAFIFMTALLPYVDWLGRRGLPRVASVLITLLAVLTLLGGMVAIVVPAVVDEFRDRGTTRPRRGVRKPPRTRIRWGTWRSAPGTSTGRA
jgi:predicted PurR-regulated permease PerM